MRRISFWTTVGLLGLVAGCTRNGREHVAPRDEREALQRVNANLGRIDQPLQYKALASFRFRDAQGHDRRFIGHEAALWFAGPRCLRFDIRSLAGVIAQFGSNDERYWVWVEPEVRKLWWGTWEALEHGSSKRLPLPPDDLLDVLMVRPLPEALSGKLGPVLRKDENDQRLLFLRLDAEGRTAGLREIRLDPYKPYQPLEIIDWLPDGRIQMHASLSKYERIGANGPYTPRHYVIYWPVDQAEMRLDVSQTSFRPDLAEPDRLETVCEFPAEWQGEVELLDAMETSGSPPTP